VFGHWKARFPQQYYSYINQLGDIETNMSLLNQLRLTHDAANSLKNKHIYHHGHMFATSKKYRPYNGLGIGFVGQPDGAANPPKAMEILIFRLTAGFRRQQP
jgi:hypothetical protein